jgi:hypothetical protein
MRGSHSDGRARKGLTSAIRRVIIGATLPSPADNVPVREVCKTSIAPARPILRRR